MNNDEKKGPRQARPTELADDEDLESISDAYIRAFGWDLVRARRSFRQSTTLVIGVHGEDMTVREFSDVSKAFTSGVWLFDPRITLDVDAPELELHIGWLARQINVLPREIALQMYNEKICDVRKRHGLLGCDGNHDPDWSKAEFADNFSAHGVLVSVPCKKCETESAMTVRADMLIWESA